MDVILSPVYIAGGLIITYTFARLLWQPKPLPGIPHNKITFVWGDLLEASRIKLEKDAIIPFFFEALAKRFGPIYQLFLGPFGHMVVLSDAQEIEDLLTRHSKSLDSSPYKLATMAGVMKFSQASLRADDPKWKKHRRLAGSSMTPKYLRNMTPRLNLSVDRLIRFWREKMRVVEEHGGSCFEAEADFQIAVMDAMGDFCLGQNFDAIQNNHDHLHDLPPQIDAHGGAAFPNLTGSRLHKSAEYLFHSMGSAIYFPMFMLPVYYFILKLGSNWRTHHGAVSSLIRCRISEARARASSSDSQGTPVQEMANCVLDMIIERERKEGLENMTDRELVDELVGLVFGGQETTAATLTFGFKFLSNHPEVQVKLRNELLANFASSSDGRLTYDELASESFPYLESVVAEILRCSGVTSIVHRRVVEDIVLLGRPIPKGIDVLCLTNYTSLRTTRGEAETAARALDPVRSKTSLDRGLSRGYWDASDATCFKPERWLVEDENPETGSKTIKFSAKQGVSMPFGGGHRACFGARLAVLELKLFVVSLNLAFFFDRVPEPLDSSEIREILTRHPKQAYLAPREWNDPPTLK